MKLSALLAPLLDAKADHETIRQVMLAFEAQQTDALAAAEAIIEEKKAQGRARYHKWKEVHSTNVSKRQSTLANSSKRPARSDTRVEDKTLPLEIEPQKEESKKEPREVALSASFEEFWMMFPNKVGKPKARAALATALRKADLPSILDGLRRYMASKPADRAWLNPATFLNQERWADQPAMPQARASPGQRINPTLVAARQLMEQFNAVPTSETETDHHPPRLLAFGGRAG